MRGIVPDEVLDRRDKIGFDAPEQSWMMAEDSPARDWLRASHKIPFLNQKAMLERFDAVASGKAAYSWQIWRWVNFVRWYEQLGMA
jgi:asparagine synthase (glutamine-hydrolysing)